MPMFHLTENSTKTLTFLNFFCCLTDRLTDKDLKNIYAIISEQVFHKKNYTSIFTRSREIHVFLIPTIMDRRTERWMVGYFKRQSSFTTKKEKIKASSRYRIRKLLNTLLPTLTPFFQQKMRIFYEYSAWGRFAQPYIQHLIEEKIYFQNHHRKIHTELFFVFINEYYEFLY